MYCTTQSGTIRYHSHSEIETVRYANTSYPAFTSVRGTVHAIPPFPFPRLTWKPITLYNVLKCSPTVPLHSLNNPAPPRTLLLLSFIYGFGPPLDSRLSTMSFGWSLGDIFAGIKILWDVYDSVSDGPLNARLECDQFFEEFSHIIQCLDDWDRKSQVVHDDSLAKLHLQLRAQCETFIGRHMRLIQSANPVTESSREGQPTWLRKVAFSREQVAVLYQKVRWPLERKEVTRLRKKLMLFLALSQHHVSTSTHNVTVENRDILLDIRYVFCLVRTSLKPIMSSFVRHSEPPHPPTRNYPSRKPILGRIGCK